MRSQVLSGVGHGQTFVGRESEKGARFEMGTHEMNLAAVRSALGKTQTEVAEAMGVTQSEISRSEQREDHLISTVRRYVQALGGELEIVARLDNREVRLRDV